MAPANGPVPTGRKSCLQAPTAGSLFVVAWRIHDSDASPTPQELRVERRRVQLRAAAQGLGCRCECRSSLFQDRYDETGTGSRGAARASGRSSGSMTRRRRADGAHGPWSLMTAGGRPAQSRSPGHLADEADDGWVCEGEVEGDVSAEPAHELVGCPAALFGHDETLKPRMCSRYASSAKT
jgi:hypothetical protein